MDDKLQEGAGAIVRRTSPSVKKTAKLTEAPAAAPTATPKAPKAKAKPAAAEVEAPVAPTPKAPKVKAKPAAAEAEAPAPTPKGPKGVKLAAAGHVEAAVPTPKEVKAAIRLTTVTDAKGGNLAAAENHSFVTDLDKIPKLLECTNPFRVFCNIPEGLLTDEQEDAWIKTVRKAGMDTLKYKKNMEQLHKQIANRVKQNLMIYGWVADEAAVVPIFGEDRFTYVFLYPSPLKVYCTKLVAAGTDEAEAKEQTLALKATYFKHLEKNEHVVVTGMVHA